MAELDDLINPSKIYRRENSSSQTIVGSPNKSSELNHIETKFNSEDNRNDIEEKDIVQLLKDLGQESKMLYISWTNQFGESSSFEEFCSNRVDNLIKEALALENNLKKQKEYLRQRVTLLG